MFIPEYLTTDPYLAAFLCHRGATLGSLRRVAAKRVEFRFETGQHLHELLRLYWSCRLVPLVPAELFAVYHDLRCRSIARTKPVPQNPHEKP